MLSVASAACAVDAMLVVDRSGSIGTPNWQKVVEYMKDRVGRTDFTDARGNRLGIVVYSTWSLVVCDMQYDAAALLACIDGIVYTGGWTNTAQGIWDAGAQLQQHSSSSRKRVIEGLCCACACGRRSRCCEVVVREFCMNGGCCRQQAGLKHD